MRPLAHGQILLRVRACGVCRTDLHIIDGELPDLHRPVVPGHEIVGEIVAVGEGVSLSIGARVGVPWLGHTCGTCEFCMRGQENLCDAALFTGYQLDGGYAELAVAEAGSCLAIPDAIDDVHAAPLLCAGLIGYRTLQMAGPAERVGIYGFGAAAHIVAQISRWRGQQVYALTRPGDRRAQSFAIEVGAHWAGDSSRTPPVPLDAALIFAPVGALVPIALGHLRKGGAVVCGGIHISDIPSFPYSLLWGERVVRSVANLTYRDGVELLDLAGQIPIRTEVATFSLQDANEAIGRLRSGEMTGAAVLTPD